MARAYGDNGRLDDTWLKDLLSPYAADHSALMDVAKLRASGFTCRKAILVYGFDYPDRPLEVALDVLDVLLNNQGEVAQRVEAVFSGLVHPVHERGRVAAWEVL